MPMNPVKCDESVERPRVAVVDYGLGNLFSIKHACLHSGLEPGITSSGAELTSADAVLLPGVGAFGDAMAALERLDLIAPIREAARSGKPIIGICLGMQLLMSESFEFGRHKGLGIIEGEVQRLNGDNGSSRPLKVPHVGWNRIHRAGSGGPVRNGWDDSPLRRVQEGAYMYFVHSYHVIPADTSIALSTTRFGDSLFCSSLKSRGIFASQFHPERSGPLGLDIYRNIRDLLVSRGREGEPVD